MSHPKDRNRIAAQIEQLNTTDETSRLDAKTASQPGKSIQQTVCAFANSLGGEILCGLKRRDNPELFDRYEIVGVPDPDKFLLDLDSALASSLNHLPALDCRSAEFDGKTVVLVIVPAVPKITYFTKEQIPRGVYFRRGTSNKRGTDADLLTILRRLQTDKEERVALSGANADDFDSALIRAYRDRKFECRGDEAEQELSEAEFLDKIGASVEEQCMQLPTAVGILLFGRMEAWRKFCSGSRIEYFRIPGEELVEPLGQGALHKVIRFEGPIYRIIKEALREVIDDLPSTPHYGLGDPHRKDFPVVRERIAREAVGNAVGHRDYDISASIQIIRYSNRIEIKNPGNSLVAVEDLKKYESRCRNPHIVVALRDVKLAENSGTGITTLRRKMEELGLPMPVFRLDSSANAFTTYLVLEKFEVPSLNFPFDDTDGFHAGIMFYVLQLKSIDLTIVQSINFQSEASATKAVGRLLSLGYLEEYEQDGAKEFRVGKIPSADSVTSGQLSVTSKEASVTSDGLPEIPVAPELATAIENFQGKRDNKILRQLILRLCESKPLSSRQLGAILSRNHRSIREHHVGPMIRLRLLTLEGSAQASNVAYRTTDLGKNASLDKLDFDSFQG